MVNYRAFDVVHDAVPNLPLGAVRLARAVGDPMVAEKNTTGSRSSSSPASRNSTQVEPSPHTRRGRRWA